MKFSPYKRLWPARPIVPHAAFLLTITLTLAYAAIPTAVNAQPSKDYEAVSEATLKPRMAIPEPTGPVVLSVSGRIRSGSPIRFDLATLESLGLIRFTTPTSWTTEPATFEGALLSDLLDVVGADPAATSLNLTALNDFESPAPIADGRKWPVVLALKRNGEYLSRRDGGPIWMIYPRYAYQEVGRREYYSRWV
jgi:hypothetical protein